jgi:hypothetical protein
LKKLVWNKMFQYNGRVLKEGQPWTDIAGVKHPANWHTWQRDEKEAHGIKEVPNLIPTLPKSLDDIKKRLLARVGQEKESLLRQTDGYILRYVETEEAIPENIKKYRNAIRTRGKEIQQVIYGLSTHDELDELSSGVLAKWPKLEE